MDKIGVEIEKKTGNQKQNDITLYPSTIYILVPWIFSLYMCVSKFITYHRVPYGIIHWRLKLHQLLMIQINLAKKFDVLPPKQLNPTRQATTVPRSLHVK